MPSPQPSALSVTSLNGHGLDMRWLQGMHVPSGVALEVLELENRCNVLVSRGQDEVSVIGDLRTGDLLVPRTPPTDPALLDLALAALTLLFAQGGPSKSAVSAGADYRSPLLDIAAVDHDSLLVRRSPEDAF